MQHFLLEGTARKQLLQSIFTAGNAAEANRAKEERATLRIQSCFRGYVCRRRFRRFVRAAHVIERVYRGYQGKLRALARRAQQVRHERELLFHHFATLIQKSFRGYHTRKWVADFYAQKRYLREIEERSREVLAASNEAHQQQVREMEEVEQAKRVKDFKKVSSRLHHLVSTASIPSVLQPAGAAAPAQLDPRLAGTFGKTAEEALRNTRLVKRKFKPDLPKGKTTSLQASTAYTAVQEEEQLQKSLERKGWVGPRFTVGKPAPPEYVSSITKDDDSFDKKVVLRSSARAQHISEKPFVTTVHGDEGFDPSLNTKLSRLPKWQEAV